MSCIEDVRRLVLEEHRELRRIICEMDTLAIRALSGDVGALEQARKTATELCDALRNHIDREDAMVVPLLRSRGLHGTSAAQQVTSHHAYQRVAVAKLQFELGQADPDEGRLVELLQLAEGLLADMAFEERHLLTDGPLEIEAIQRHLLAV
ncbi:MAG: hemerythrin domain-containing protein [Myxococcota bacterium]